MNFVFFNNKQDPNGAVVHSGDNLTGAGDGDDEQINLNTHDAPEFDQWRWEEFWQPLNEVVDFYDERFSIGLTDQEKADLVAFLGAL